MDCESLLRRNLQDITDRIASACHRCGRDPSSVRLVAVTKYAQLDWVQALVQIGIHDLGESRPQQLVERVPLLPNHVRWHLIGHLQRNKVRPILPFVSLTHSVDTFRLLDRIDRLAAETNSRPRVLLEVNIASEASKDGFDQPELVREWPRIAACENVQIDGLMTMAPHTNDPEDARPVFRRLRELRDELLRETPDRIVLPELSMGMSNDFDVAIEEGATTVRVGSLLFEGLDG